MGLRRGAGRVGPPFARGPGVRPHVVALLAGVLGAAGGGCASAPRPAPLPRALELPPSWSAAPSPFARAIPRQGTGIEAPPAELSWWDSFGDARVRAVVEEALAHNLDLAAAAARLDAAAAEARIAGADALPRVDLEGGRTRRRQVWVGLPIPGKEGPLVTRSTSWGVSLDTSWEVDLWGRLRAQRSAAAAELQAALADYRGARLSLGAQALKAWFAAQEADRQVELAEGVVRSFQDTLDRVRFRYQQGVRPSVDVRLARVDLARAQAGLEVRRAQRDRAVRQLEHLLGRYPGGTIALEGELAPPPAPVPAGLPVELLRRRPDLVAAERRLAAADRSLAESRRALLPRLSLTASGGRTSDRLHDLLRGDFTVWSLAAGVLQPLFQGGRLRANVARQRAFAERALAEYAERVLLACGEVESALAAERFLAREDRALAEAAEQARAAFELVRSRYEKGLADAFALLSSQRSLADAQSRLLGARRRRLHARVDLLLVLGGGFETSSTELGGAFGHSGAPRADGHDGARSEEAPGPGPGARLRIGEEAHP